MSKRTGLVRRGAAAAAGAEGASQARALANDVADLDAAPEIGLPREHPRWARDRRAPSAGARARRGDDRHRRVRLVPPRINYLACS
jgi:hypothetical protein